MSTCCAATRCLCVVCCAFFVACGSTSTVDAFMPLDIAFSRNGAHHRAHHRRRAPARCGSVVRDDDSQSNGDVPQYRSRSTAQPDAEAEFAVGSAARQQRLDEALRDLGFDPCVLTEDVHFRGSAALRMYNSFILPKSKGAFATAELPQRASVIANSIAFKAREMRSHEEDWLRNHDKSLVEIDKDQKQRYPLTIVLDNVRSAHNVGNILRLAEGEILCDTSTLILITCTHYVFIFVSTN